MLLYCPSFSFPSFLFRILLKVFGLNKPPYFCHCNMLWTNKVNHPQTTCHPYSVPFKQRLNKVKIASCNVCDESGELFSVFRTTTFKLIESLLCDHDHDKNDTTEEDVFIAVDLYPRI